MFTCFINLRTIFILYLCNELLGLIAFLNLTLIAPISYLVNAHDTRLGITRKCTQEWLSS